MTEHKTFNNSVFAPLEIYSKQVIEISPTFDRFSYVYMQSIEIEFLFSNIGIKLDKEGQPANSRNRRREEEQRNVAIASLF